MAQPKQVLLRRQEANPGVLVWSGLTANASSRLDVAAATSRVTLAVPQIASLLGKQIAHLSSTDQASTVPVLDPAGFDAFKRLQRRADSAQLDLWELLWEGEAADWERCFVTSFAAGVSRDLQESTLQYQLVQEFRVALLIGRRLCFESLDLAVSMKRTFQYRAADGSLLDVNVDLIFPGEARSIVRLLQAWWDAKGGKPSTKEAKLAHAAAKPSNRAMPTRFTTNMLMLVYWQAKLLTSLVEIDKQMLANKAAGVPNWFHPSSLCSGGRYANSSVCITAVQCALGMLSCAWHEATGGRQAEMFRCRKTDSGVEGVSSECKPPVWVLGLAGADVLRAFQAAQGTGWYMINWHCKGKYDYGSPDYMPIWPSSMSGICLAAIITLAMVVLTYMHPTSPAKPITQHKKGEPARQTLNNACGYFFPYGDLKHLPALDDPDRQPISASDMARIINAAISSAGFLGNCWTDVRAAGTATAPDAAFMSKYHNPSEYSKRYTLSGEAKLMLELLGTDILPADFWVWYLQRVGRSELTNSFATYVAAYIAAYGNRLPYLRDGAGRAMATVTFVRIMLGWSPATANKDICSQLTEAQQAALKKAVEMGQQFAANPTTPVIWEHLTSVVKQEGSLAGMLRCVTVPLLHHYVLPAFEAGPDLTWLCMTPTEALAYRTKQLQTISSAVEALYGPQPQPPARLVLLQNTIDLLCADVDNIKLSLAFPQARTNACVGSATAAVLSALHSAAAVAAATARGDDAAASRAAIAAAASTQAAAQHAQQLQLDASDMPAALFGGQASVEAEAEASGDLAGPSDTQPTAAAARTVSSSLPITALADYHSTTPPPTSAAAAIHSAAPSSAGTSLQLAAAGAEVATELAQVPTSPLLRRGAGLLVLFQNNWGGKAELLQAGRALVAGKTFTHSSVLQLMSEQGLLLRAGSEQSVSVRVAAEYLQPSTPLTGNWSKSCFTISIHPGVNLLLHSPATHTWGRKFTVKCSAAVGYAALFPGLSQQNIATALGRLEYEPHRPVRSCAELTNAANKALLQVPAARSGSAGASLQQQQHAPAVQAAASPVQTSSEPPTGGGELAAAQTAVNELALSMSGAEADAAYASACVATAVLLRRSNAPASSNIAAAVRSGLLEMYQVVDAGNAPPVAVLKQLLAQLREAAAGCSNCIVVDLPAKATGAESLQQVASSSNKRQNVAAVASSSKKPKQPPLQQRAPPDDADQRPGLWLTGGFYAQLGDTVIQQVKAADKDPCTFNVYSSEGEVASAWVWRLEAFTDDSVTGRFYFNQQRSLHEPLSFQRRVQKLPRPAGVAGVVCTLEPDKQGNLSEVVQQLDASVVAEVLELLFAPVDSDSESE